MNDDLTIVYVVAWSYYDDWCIHGVFATCELAEKYIREAIKEDRNTILNQYKIIPQNFVK